jgi:O-methyltransferase involved in polyketide biosynthesis
VTSDHPETPPRSGIDSSVPHSARIWNYWLGGKDNYPVDREAGDQWLATAPEIRDIARASREFLARAVRHLVEQEGVRQFLDVGTGLPTADNTHEVAQRHAPDARIVYVDHDPLVLAHARALLTSTPEGVTRYVDADMRDTGTILTSAAEFLDFTRPVALLFMGVLGHVADYDEARTLVRTLLDALPSGSFLVISDGSEAEAVLEAEQDYAESGAIPYVNRSKAQVAGFFEGLERVEPGLVNVNLWRPTPLRGVTPLPGRSTEPKTINSFAGVGRKP